jgi:pyruvate/2-oxoglutarate dehydrogenase complex dihydrolipoamide dehydrogenase (E3) component
MELEATIDEIKNTVYPHPATAEIIWEAASTVK